MAKSEGRGWRSFVPSARTIVKIFIVLVAIKFANRYVLQSVPANVAKYWPAF